MEEIKEKIKEFLEIADEFIKEMHVTDVALLKICLMSLGIIMGICMPKKWKRPVFFTMLFVFIVTYLPLVTKWGSFLGRSCCELRREMRD